MLNIFKKKRFILFIKTYRNDYHLFEKLLLSIRLLPLPSPADADVEPAKEPLLGREQRAAPRLFRVVQNRGESCLLVNGQVEQRVRARVPVDRQAQFGPGRRAFESEEKAHRRFFGGHVIDPERVEPADTIRGPGASSGR